MLFDLRDDKGCLDKALKKAKKVPKIAAVIELCKRPRVVPVSEPKAITQWVGSEHDDKREDDQTWEKSAGCVGLLAGACLPTMSRTLPSAAQNSVSPYHLTVMRFMSLKQN